MSRTSPGADAPQPIWIESLEGRCLLSGTVDSADAAAPPPAVRLLGRNLVTGGTHYTFSLLVRSTGGTSPPLDGDDVELRGPNGYAAAAEITRAVQSPSTWLLSCRVAAPGGTFDRSDNGLYTLSLRPPEVGPARILSTSSLLGRFRVASRAAPDPRPALPLSNTATAGALSVTFDRAFAWCDHMPWIGEDPGRQYLVMRTTLKNNSDAPLEVRLTRAFISFDENQLGEETQGVSLRGRDGRPSGEKTLLLQPGEQRTVEFRGDRLFPEGRDGQTLYATLEFAADGATAAVRNSSKVYTTW